MNIHYGIDAKQRAKGGAPLQVEWDSSVAVNGHGLLLGLSGSGKTHLLRNMLTQMNDSRQAKVRFHIFDAQGDMHMGDESCVMFSEQTPYGINPLRVHADPDFGGVRKKAQSFLSVLARVTRSLGTKQEAVLRNVIYDVYRRHGFDPDNPATWDVDDRQAVLLSDGRDGKLFLDVPEEEVALAIQLGAVMDEAYQCVYVPVEKYVEPFTQWAPRRTARSNPNVEDLLRYARSLRRIKFLGSSQKALAALEVANKTASQMHRTMMASLRTGSTWDMDPEEQERIEAAKSAAIKAHEEYVLEIQTGTELEDLLRYESADVLASVVTRLENLNSIGIFKSTVPPFDPRKAIWRYDIKALSLEEQRLFVNFRLEEIYTRAMSRGLQNNVLDVLVLDEANNYVDDATDNILNVIANKGRKFGIAMLCSSQSPAHFSVDFMGAVATKIILGIDESHWQVAQKKMRVPLDALGWIKLKRSRLIQIKNDGDARIGWNWVQD